MPMYDVMWHELPSSRSNTRAHSLGTINAIVLNWFCVALSVLIKRHIPYLYFYRYLPR